MWNHEYLTVIISLSYKTQKNVSFLNITFTKKQRSILLKILTLIRLIPQWTVDNNLGPDRFRRSQGSRSQLLQTTNPLIARSLSGSPNCAWYWVTPVWGQGIPPTHTNIVAHLTWQQKVQLLTSVSMMRFGPSIEPITFPTPSRYAMCYATDAGLRYSIRLFNVHIFNFMTKLLLFGYIKIIGNQY